MSLREHIWPKVQLEIKKGTHGRVRPYGKFKSTLFDTPTVYIKNSLELVGNSSCLDLPKPTQ